MTVRKCPRYAGKIWLHSFISTVRPTVHANPSRKRNFPNSKTVPQIGNLKTPVLRFRVDGTRFEKMELCMKVDLGQNVRLVVSLWRFVVSTHRYSWSTRCFPRSTRRIASSTLRFTSSTHLFVVVCRFVVLTFRYGISSFRCDVSSFGLVDS